MIHYASDPEGCLVSSLSAQTQLNQNNRLPSALPRDLRQPAMTSVMTKPAEPAKPTKRTTRSSIRQSLNLASVGKALADVMNKEKDTKDTDRKKDSGRRQSASLSGKDSAARRTSVIAAKGGSTLETVPEVQAKAQTSPSDQKTVTASRRVSSSLQRAGRSSVDETGMKVTSTTPSQSGTLNNRSTTTLRPRKPAASSALPKYRPKSVIVEGSSKGNLSAIRIGSRRKHSTSEEDKDSDSLETNSLNGLPTEMDKAERPISPLPRRASKAGGSRSSSIDGGRPSVTRASLERTPTTSTPPRSKKTQKPSLSPVLKKSSLPRPSPRGDSPVTSSGSPHTPTSAKKIASRYLMGNSGSGGRESPSPLRASTTVNSASRRNTITSVRKGSVTTISDSNQNTPIATIPPSSSDKESQGNDSVDDIEMMLAAIASPSAPTPAIPRIGQTYFAPPQPETPSRNSRSILDLSLGLSTPQSDRLMLPTSRRGTPNRRPAADRNSVAAWQALADLSLEINADQLQGGLITELDLPSTPLGLISPSPSIIRMDSEDGHERSPTPLNLPSPTKYASISQMLLPNVTPSPVPVPHQLHGNHSTGSDMTATESATVMLLKLQLASFENLAKERLTQISKLEEQMHVLKESRKRDERELLTHVNELEERLHETLAAQQRTRSRATSVCSYAMNEVASRPDDADSHAACQDALEEHMRKVEDEHHQAVNEALSELAERERAERARLLVQMEQKQRLAFASRDALQHWTSVREIADGELESIHANRETLAVLRAGLDFFEAQIHISRAVKIPPSAAARFHLT